ncbi:MAG: T9SS type A sorting domain-containing protein [Bacteroidia bacterium]|nr:T9SS type A sorting domain-containing protein [Bacteroidia bacterium]
MKKILLTLSMVFFFLMGYSQYYYIPYVDAGINPGGINTFDELPVGAGLDPSWTVIHEGAAAAPAWTPILNMPFLFYFNGQPAFQFKVSTTGVLTFETSSTVLPPSQNINIPTALVPNNSVCIWGLNGAAADDKIVMRTFTNGDNKQLWISYINYGYNGSIPICNHYFSIVLEENTNSIYLVDQKGSAISTCSPSLTMGIQIDAETAISVDGSPAVKSQAGTDPKPADNTYYEFVPGEQPRQDVRGLEVDVPETVLLTEAPVVIKGKFLSIGADELKSFDLHYTINNGPVKTQHYSGTFSSLNVSHNIPWIPTALGSYDLKLWITDPNGEPDAKPADNELFRTIKVVDKAPPRLALIESFTQHNCGPCAAQNPALDALIHNNFHNTAVVKWIVTWPAPNDDPRHHFNVPANSARRTYYAVNGVPNTILGGSVFNGAPGGVNQTMVNTENAKPNMFDFDFTESVTGNNINVSVAVTPLQNPGLGNLTLQVAVIQDELHYPAATGSNGEKDFYEIMRYAIPSAAGTSINTTVGQTSTVSGSVAVNSIFNKSFMRIIAWVQNDATKEIFAVSKSQGIYFCANGSKVIATPTVTEASCAGNDGGISMSVSGGMAPYSFAWNTGQTTQIITGKSAGNYTVTITDGAGCAFSVPVKIAQKPSPNVVISPSDVFCNGDTDGAIKTYVAGGATPYTYSWSNGATTKDISGLAPGSYTLTMTDADGCSIAKTATVANTPVLAATGASDHPDNGTNNGKASVAVSGGTHHYTYSWSHSASVTGASASDLASGSYTVNITDYKGCQTSVNITVDSNVGIEDLARAGISRMEVYPNPTQGVFTLDIEMAKTDDLSVAIFDINGKVVYQTNENNISRFNEKIDMNGVAAGIYTLKVTTSKGVGYERVVVK